MKEGFREDQSEMVGNIEVVGGISKSQATVLLADEEKRRKKRAVR